MLRKNFPRRREQRRKDAVERQAVHAARQLKEKLARAGARERARLEAAHA